MFDLIAGKIERPLREPAPGSKAASLIVHIAIVTLAVAIPVLRVTAVAVERPSMAAFVAMPPAPPPPPPPPPSDRVGAPRRAVQPMPKTPEAAAPIDVPLPQPVATTGAGPTAVAGGGIAGGMAGGVAGGVPGGVIGGVVGGMISTAPPPPPAPAAPVRVGGQIRTPQLLHRVEPVYPPLAVAARLTGVVVLEAQVGTDGTVESVNVAQSRHRLLDAAAIEALRQWRYAPLVLNDIPTPFVLTVTFTFSTRR